MVYTIAFIDAVDTNKFDKDAPAFWQYHPVTGGLFNTLPITKEVFFRSDVDALQPVVFLKSRPGEDIAKALRGEDLDCLK